MSIVQKSEFTDGSQQKKVNAVLLRSSVNKKGEIQAEIADYNPSQEVVDVRAMILK